MKSWRVLHLKIYTTVLMGILTKRHIHVGNGLGVSYQNLSTSSCAEFELAERVGPPTRGGGGLQYKNAPMCVLGV